MSQSSQSRARALTAVVCFLLLARVAVADLQTQALLAQDLSRLSIEELSRIKVTSVSKTEEPLSLASAAVYVITNEAIRRSGAVTLAEILRLAPNLHVARLDANTYGISARGFNQQGGTANKLLVLIDGRAIYSPLFSGTFWDAQKTVAEDIDRIEVISGPGGTLWGGNAVTGVINIITKEAVRTRGTMASVRAGTLDNRIDVRHGMSLGATGNLRIYGLGIHQGEMRSPAGEGAGDAWNHVQGGFRADWQRSDGGLTVQGDVYRGTGIGRPAARRSGEITGSNLSATLDRELRDGAIVRVQAYTDAARRLLISGIDAEVRQHAVETQYNFARRGRHAIVAGAGYRMTDDRFERGPGTSFLDPAERKLHFTNVFAQDTVSFGERLRVTAGVKLEHNSYTGLEVFPDARIAWSLNDSRMLWSAVSRAIRTPSRFDRDLTNRGLINGGPEFHSEELVAFEAGYRALVSPALTVSISAFYNDYDDLRTLESVGNTPFPVEIRNGMRGTSTGIEAWGDLSLRDWWRVSAGVATLDQDLETKPGSRDLFGTAFAGNDPRYRWMLRSSVDLGRRTAVDLSLRGVGKLESPAVDAYVEADLRVGWTISEALELALVGQNLLAEQHREFANAPVPPTEVPRSMSVSVRWTR